MTSDDVFGDEMDEPHDFDDETAESLLGGFGPAGPGRDVDPELADLLGDVHVAYTSTPPAVGAELAALIGPTAPVPTSPRRFERMRASLMAKIGVATAAVLTATGGLAVAGALPSPVQHAISHIGRDDNSHKGPKVGRHDHETTTTVEGETTTTVEDRNDDHGKDVEAEAHDHDGEGCEHGDDVSETASEGRSENPCVTTTTVEGTPPTTDDDGNEGHGHDGDGKDHDGTTTTTTTVGTSPTTVDHRGPGRDGDGGGDHGGDDGGSGHDGSGHGGSGDSGD